MVLLRQAAVLFLLVCDHLVFSNGHIGPKLYFPYQSPLTLSVYRVVRGSLTGIQKAFDDPKYDTIAKGEEFTVLVDFNSSIYNKERQWYEIPARFCYGNDTEKCAIQKRSLKHPYLVRPSSVQIPVPFVVPFSKLHNVTLPDGSTVNEAGTVHEQFKTFQVNGTKYDTSTGILASFSAESPQNAGKISGIDFLRDTRRVLKQQPLVQCYFVEWTADGCVPGLANLMLAYNVKDLQLKYRPWLKTGEFPKHRDDKYTENLDIPGIGEKEYLVLKDMTLEKSSSPIAHPFVYLFASVEEQVNTTLESVGLRYSEETFLGSGKYKGFSKHYEEPSYSAAMSGTEFRYFRASMSVSYLEDEANWDDSFRTRWKSLFVNRNKGKVYDFFREYGTHYVVNAVMGGRQETIFTVDYCKVSKDKKTKVDFKTKLVKPYKKPDSSSVDIQTYYNNMKNHSSKVISSGPQTTCTGGNSLDSEVCQSLTRWKESVLSNPYPIRMTVKPFYTLVKRDEDRLWVKKMYQEYLKAGLDKMDINKDITVKAKCEKNRGYLNSSDLFVALVAGIVILELWL